MRLEKETRHALRAIQRCLDASLPPELLAGVERDDLQRWSDLALLELRMLLARGQALQARRFAERLSVAAAASLPVESFAGREAQNLFNAMDAAQGHRHYLAHWELESALVSTQPLVRWASQLWLAWSLAAEGELERARHLTESALQLCEGMPLDATLLATCFAAELQARAGDMPQAQERLKWVLSEFERLGDFRGTSFAQLSLARALHLDGHAEASEDTAREAFRKDASWPGPAVVVARLALQSGRIDEAEQLLRATPNPTIEAQSLIRAVALVKSQTAPLDVALRNLELAAEPAGTLVVETLRALLRSWPEFVPARETLAWKCLSIGRLDEVRLQIDELSRRLGNGESVAALAYGLQTRGSDFLDDLDSLFDEPDATSGGEPGASAPVDSVRGPDGVRPGEDPAPGGASPADAATQGGMVGSISLFGVPDLVQFLGNSRRTGRLVLSSQRGDAAVRLQDGAIVWATSPRQPSVGRFVGERCSVELADLDAFDAEPLEACNLLLADGTVEQGPLRAALADLVRLVLKDLLEWADGWFVFRGEQNPTAAAPELLQNTQAALLDALRELDERGR